jgi:hypothetical protein
MVPNRTRKEAPMSTKTAPRASFVLPADAFERYAMLLSMKGSWVRLTSGDFVIEGTLASVIRPAHNSDEQNPIVVIVTGAGNRVAGPVLAGDTLS